MRDEDDPEGQKEDGLLSEIACQLSPDEGHEAKLKRYATAKERAVKVSEHIISNFPEKFKLGAKVYHCGSFLIFHHYYTVDEYRLGKSNFCRKHLFCGLCAILRAAKQLRSYLDKVDLVLTDNPGLVLIFVTITVKNGPDLMERFHHLQNNYRKMVERRRNLQKGRTTDTVFKHFQGAVATYELTRGDGSPRHPDTGWHPHLHMICAVSPSVDCSLLTAQLKREWEELTGDSHQCLAKPIDYADEDERIGAFVEVFKYPLKFNDMRVSDQVHAGLKLRQNRLIASFGLFYGVKDPVDLEDVIEEDLSLLPYVELMYGYSPTFGYQLKEQKLHDPCGWNVPVSDDPEKDARLSKLRQLQLTQKSPDEGTASTKFVPHVKNYFDRIQSANDKEGSL